MRIFIILAIVFSISTLTVGQSLTKKKLSEHDITIMVPSEFVEMIPEDIVQRLPSVRKPIAAYTDLQRTADLSVKISATQWGDNDLEIAQSFFKASIMDLFDKVEFLDEGIKEIKKKDFIFFEFESYVRGTDTSRGSRQYNYLMYYIKDRQTLVFSFKSPDRDMEKYQSRVQEIFATVKIGKF